MTAVLITVKQASDHLRLDVEDEAGSPAGSPSEEDPRLAELQQKMSDAEGIVLDYLEIDTAGSPSELEWTAETVPGPVRAAILDVLHSLWDDRAGAADHLSPGVKNTLRRYREPVIS